MRGRINRPSPGETDKKEGWMVLRIVKRSPGRADRFERAALGSPFVVKLGNLHHISRSAPCCLRYPDDGLARRKRGTLPDACHHLYSGRWCCWSSEVGLLLSSRVSHVIFQMEFGVRDPQCVTFNRAGWTFASSSSLRTTAR